MSTVDDAAAGMERRRLLSKQIDAQLELMKERNRALRIRQGLPADLPPFDFDAARAEAAVLRAENDLMEARAILSETRRRGAA